MAFLGDLSQKAKGLAESTRINSLISDEEKKINNNYRQLGKLYVSSHSEDYEEIFADIIVSIQNSQKKIQEYREQIWDIKGVVRCANCGATAQKGAAFCSTCGKPMPKEQPTADAAGMVKCKHCGAMMKKDMRFCTACGKPMEQSADCAKTDYAGAAENMKACPYCGAMITADSAFCTECGASISGKQIAKETDEKNCPHCGAVVAQDSLFCAECGFKLSAQEKAARCPNCGNQVEEGMAFCIACGSPLMQMFDEKTSIEETTEKRTIIAETEPAAHEKSIGSSFTGTIRYEEESTLEVQRTDGEKTAAEMAANDENQDNTIGNEGRDSGPQSD